MTAAERAEQDRREAIREARYRGFVERTMEANQRTRERQERLLEETRLKRCRQPELDFAI